MRGLRSAIRALPAVYGAYRRFVMTYKRFRFGLANVDATFFMAGQSYVASDLIAGPFSYLGSDCYIGPGVTLGAYVMLGPRVAIVGADHRFDVPGVPMIFAGRPALKVTSIEDDVWIGYGAVIMAGVTIGRGSIVAAGSVVTRDIPPYEIHAGVPARKLRDRFESSYSRSRHDAMLSEPVRAGRFAQTLF